MLVLVSFVLVLAAAVTLVVGLLQSGLTLIYLSIGCSVLAGVVLAVAVLRGRPEPKSAPVGTPYTAPAAAPPAPASYSAPAPMAAPAPAQTTSFSPPPPTRAAAPVSDEAATKAAGTALLGRLRGRRSDETPPVEPAPMVAPEPMTMEMAAVSANDNDDEDFPIADYDELRATDLLRRLSALDRNQLEAVRARESEAKNRFTILSRIDTLLAAKEEPAWEVDDDEWEADATPSVIAVGPVDDEDDAGDLEDDEFDDDDEESDDDEEVDEVDELVSPVDEFPIAGYDSLTVGQILPRLSELDADELADVRAREQQGRARGTILDRVDRLAAKSSVARPSRAPARKAPAATRAPAPRQARAASTTPMREAVRKAAASKAPARKATKATAAPAPPQAPFGRKVAAPTPMKEAVKKAAATKKAPAAAKAARTAAPPMKEAVKKARAAKRP